MTTDKVYTTLEKLKPFEGCYDKDEKEQYQKLSDYLARDIEHSEDTPISFRTIYEVCGYDYTLSSIFGYKHIDEAYEYIKSLFVIDMLKSIQTLLRGEDKGYIEDCIYSFAEETIPDITIKDLIRIEKQYMKGETVCKHCKSHIEYCLRGSKGNVVGQLVSIFNTHICFKAEGYAVKKYDLDIDSDDGLNLYGDKAGDIAEQQLKEVIIKRLLEYCKTGEKQPPLKLPKIDIPAIVASIHKEIK